MIITVNTHLEANPLHVPYVPGTKPKKNAHKTRFLCDFLGTVPGT
jgi:hypothetical protein